MLLLELAVHLMVQECNIVAVILRSRLVIFFDLGAFRLSTRNVSPQSLIAVNLASLRA